jgi:hypothetical protein
MTKITADSSAALRNDKQKGNAMATAVAILAAAVSLAARF